MSQSANNHPVMNMLGRLIGFMQAHNSKVRILDFVVAVGFIGWGIWHQENLYAIIGVILFIIALINPYALVMKLLNRPPKIKTPPNSLS